jgi:hypothetical protein
MDAQVRDATWDLWGRWLLATLVGWFVGIIAAIAIMHNVYDIGDLFYRQETDLIVVIVGLVPGAGIGLAQMMAVRQVLPLTQRWVWGAVVGMGIPFIVAMILDEVWLGPEPPTSGMWLVPVAMAGGALAGLIQVPTLRRHTSRAQWWVPASLVSWAISWLIIVAWGVGAGILFGGAVLGVVSGALLIWILRSSPGHEAV